MSLPPPDPAKGSAAAQDANVRRDEVRDMLTDGALTLAEVFTEVESESKDGHFVIGHMHVRGALIALPRIGEKKADEILAGLGIEPDRHLASIGSDQRKALLQEVADRS